MTLGRTSRRTDEVLDDIQRADYNPDFRTDLERIRFSPYFGRLAAVTQVISQPGSGAFVHNRLTHSIKVTAVARSIAVHVDAELEGSTKLVPIGECDAVVVQAAASAHDLGHPPFGHLGEQVLDKIARSELGLIDGFEGNAQTYRIVTSMDVTESAERGLNLTAAVRTAVAKYPWTVSTAQELSDAPVLPRGLKRLEDKTVIANKYSAYLIDATDLWEARQAHGNLSPFRQSVECAAMDIADDIAYSVHDVDDFYRAGVLGHWSVAGELNAWLDNQRRWAISTADELALGRPGAALERLRRKILRDDPWVADDDAIRDAVERIKDDLVDGLLREPYDGSISAERGLASFTDRWISHLQRSVVAATCDNPRVGPLTLTRAAWHEVEVLKFIHKNFVLGRPDLAMYQRGLRKVLVRTVRGLRSWIDDEDDMHRAPRRLRELIALARQGYTTLLQESPDALGEDRPGIHELAAGRGVIDYVASLNDNQALAVSEAIAGRSDRLWGLGQNL